MRMLRLLLICAVVAATLVAAALLAATGAFLAAFEQSGERVPGVLAVLAAAAMLAAAFVLLRRSGARAAERKERAVAAIAGVAVALPLALLAAAAIAFAGSPFGSRTPAIDWAVFSAGVLFAGGAASALVLAWRRGAPPGPRRPEGAAPPAADYRWDGDVRVTRI
jgi:hypothetical protein